jgi:hypothetical protein
LQALAEAVPWADTLLVEVERQLHTSLTLGRPRRQACVSDRN